MLEAIITIKQQWGYGGDLTTPGTFESVGFWLIEQNAPPEIAPLAFVWPGSPAPLNPPGRRWIGEIHVHVFDILRVIAAPTGYLRYAVRLLLSPDMAQFIRLASSQQPGQGPVRLPKLHAVLQWNQVVNNSNFGGAGVFWGAVLQADIQYPKRSTWGEWQFLERDTDPARESHVFPMHMVMLKNKKILMFSGSGNVPYPPWPLFDLSKTAALFDPDTNMLQEIPSPSHEITYHPIDPRGTLVDSRQWLDDAHTIPNPHWNDYSPLFNNLLTVVAQSHDVFCSGHSVLPDGRVIVFGGTEVFFDSENPIPDSIHHGHYPGLRRVSIYDPDTNSWEQLSNEMKHGRWYPSTVVLGDGRVFVMNGHTDAEDNTRHNNSDLEIYDGRSNSWRFKADANPNTGPFPGDPGLYPRLHLLPDGSVFCATRISYSSDSSLIDKFCKWIPSTETWVPVNDGTYVGGPTISKFSTINRVSLLFAADVAN